MGCQQISFNYCVCIVWKWSFESLYSAPDLLAQECFQEELQHGHLLHPESIVT